VSRSDAWTDALERLRRADLDAIKRTFPRYPHPDLLRAIEVSIQGLEQPDRDRYLDLAVFPKDQPIPKEALCALLSLEDEKTRDFMALLVNRSLAFPAESEKSLLLHDLQHDLIRRRRRSQLPALHGRLLDGWGEPTNLTDQYALRWLPWHLNEAGRALELRRLLLSFDWLRAKLNATDLMTVLADYNFLPANDKLYLIKDALLLSAHVLARDKEQLKPHLFGRLISEDTAEIRELLNEIGRSKKSLWLRPITQSLRPPGEPLIRVVKADFGTVWAMAVSPQADKAITAGDDGNLKVWDLLTGRLLHTLKGHKQGVTSVTLNQDGSKAVSGSEDFTLKLWDLKTGSELRSFRGHRYHINSVAITRDGSRAVSGSSDGTMKVWNLNTGAEVLSLEQEGQIIAVTVDAEGEIAVSGSDVVKVWHLGTGQPAWTIEARRGAVRSVSVASDRSRLVFGCDDGTVEEWNLRTGLRSCFLIEPGARTELQTYFGRMAMTLDGGRAICRHTTRLGSFIVWDLENCALLYSLEIDTGQEYGARIYALADGRYAVTASDNQVLMIWSLATDKKPETRKAHADSVKALAPDPQNRWLLSASADKTVKVWDLDRYDLIASLEGHSNSVQALAITGDGRFAISASEDRTLKLWDLKSHLLVHTFESARLKDTRTQ
jgi:WD40 repeat protein